MIKLLEKIFAILNYNIMKIIVKQSRKDRYEKVSDCCNTSYKELFKGLINKKLIYICDNCKFYCKLIERLKEK